LSEQGVIWRSQIVTLKRLASASTPLRIGKNSRSMGSDVNAAEDLLRVVREILKTFQSHRRMILADIAADSNVFSGRSANGDPSRRTSETGKSKSAER
jgi:hypothetical protein